MQSVRLHTDGKGVLWLLGRCGRCGQVHKYLAATATTAPVHCKSCNALLQIEGAVLGKPSSELPPG